jgi:hypothetical protein
MLVASWTLQRPHIGSKELLLCASCPSCAKPLAAIAKLTLAFCATSAEQGSAPLTIALLAAGQTKATDIKRKRNHKQFRSPRTMLRFEE